MKAEDDGTHKNLYDPTQVDAVVSDLPIMGILELEEKIEGLEELLKEEMSDNQRLRKNRELRKEICICAAVITGNGTVIKGHRHCDCFAAIKMRNLKETKIVNSQGFITSKDRFVNRKEALTVQKEAGIESIAEGGYRGNNLYSEDLY